jgi:hypothetical protein
MAACYLASSQRIRLEANAALQRPKKYLAVRPRSRVNAAMQHRSPRRAREISGASGAHRALSQALCSTRRRRGRIVGTPFVPTASLGHGAQGRSRMPKAPHSGGRRRRPSLTAPSTVAAACRAFSCCRSSACICGLSHRGRGHYGRSWGQCGAGRPETGSARARTGGWRRWRAGSCHAPWPASRHP